MGARVLANDDFFRYALAECEAKTYLEVFGGTGARTIRPLYGQYKITTTENDQQRRNILLKQFPEIELFPDFQSLAFTERQWDVVSSDPPMGLSVKGKARLGFGVMLPYLQQWARRCIITYVPLNIADYVVRCGSVGFTNVPKMEQELAEIFGGLEPSPELFADCLGGELLAIRQGTNRNQLVYCAVRL